MGLKESCRSLAPRFAIRKFLIFQGRNRFQVVCFGRNKVFVVSRSWFDSFRTLSMRQLDQERRRTHGTGIEQPNP